MMDLNFALGCPLITLHLCQPAALAVVDTVFGRVADTVAFCNKWFHSYYHNI